VQLEANILRPILFGRDVARYTVRPPSHWVIFPHDPETGAPFPPRRLRQDAPLTWAYFQAHRDALGSRVRDAKRGVKYRDLEHFYMLHRPRVPDLYTPSVILTPALVNESEFALNRDGCTFVGGTAGIYGILPRTDCPVSPAFLLGCLNSSLYTYYFKMKGRPKRGGYHQLNGTILNQTPVAAGTGDVARSIETAVRSILAGEELGELREQIDAGVYDLFEITPEERDFIAQILNP